MGSLESWGLQKGYLGDRVDHPFGTCTTDKPGLVPKSLAAPPVHVLLLSHSPPPTGVTLSFVSNVLTDKNFGVEYCER